MDELLSNRDDRMSQRSNNRHTLEVPKGGNTLRPSEVEIDRNNLTVDAGTRRANQEAGLKRGLTIGSKRSRKVSQLFGKAFKKSSVLSGRIGQADESGLNFF